MTTPDALRTLALEFWQELQWCEDMALGDHLTYATVEPLILRALAAAHGTSQTLNHELCDLITLMPDSQVDEILAFIATLREARGLAQG